MNKNRIDFAKYLLLSYVKDLFIEIAVLVSADLEEAINMPAHGLNQDELVVVLYEMFKEFRLVAMSETRDLFTPSLAEIESALKENIDLMFKSKSTFYGLTSAGFEQLSELNEIYGIA